MEVRQTVIGGYKKIENWFLMGQQLKSEIDLNTSWFPFDLITCFCPFPCVCVYPPKKHTICETSHATVSCVGGGVKCGRSQKDTSSLETSPHESLKWGISARARGCGGKWSYVNLPDGNNWVWSMTATEDCGNKVIRVGGWGGAGGCLYRHGDENMRLRVFFLFLRCLSQSAHEVISRTSA